MEVSFLQALKRVNWQVKICTLFRSCFLSRYLVCRNIHTLRSLSKDVLSGMAATMETT